jgi:5,10-methylenetetrahydromethanopterin reductase
MQIGIFTDVHLLPDIQREIAEAQADGVDSFWITQGFGHDALGVISAFGAGLSGMRIGTAVVPVYPRHPMVLAQQALTTSQIIGGNLVLGIGSSHPSVVGPCWGMSYDRPARYMDEYVDALTGSLTQHVRFTGEVLTARGDLTIAGNVEAPAVMIAALGPAMLRVAGAKTAGTITWMVGRRTLRDLTVPVINDAADRAGRIAPEIVVTVPICVTADPATATASVDRDLAWFNDRPSYRAMLDREGLASAGGLALVGSADQVRDGIASYADAGATTVAVQFYGDPDERAAGRQLVRDLIREERES